MATLFKDVKYNLNTLIQNIDIGTIALPEIQRPFVWKDKKVRDLFDSLYKGYPVGYFLFWETLDDASAKNIGTDQKQKIANLLIVDGQQRLTSLYAVIKGKEVVREDYSTEKIKISFNPLEKKFVIPDAATRRSAKYFQDISEIWAPNVDVFQLVTNFINKMKESNELSPENITTIQNAFMQLKNLEDFPFSVLELSQEMDEEQVADVFVRINSEGKKLNQADFILTLMSVFWDEGRNDLENFSKQSKLPSKSEASPFNYIIEPSPDQMLRASVGLAFRRARLQYIYSILRGKDLETGKVSTELRENQFARLKESQAQALNIQNWHEFLKAINQAGYTNGKYVSSDNNLLYSYVFFLMGKIDFKVDLYELKHLIARWFFMCCVTGRYTGSPESKMEMDLANFRGLETKEDFKKQLNDIIESQLTNDFWEITLPLDMATSSSRSPSLFAYYAALNVHNALGLFSKLPVNELLRTGLRANKSPLEKHHLFPKAWLIRSGITESRDYNQIANFALIEWSDNIDISDQPPKDYFPKYESRFDEETLDKMKYWHALPDDWVNMGYEDFLQERRVLIAKVIRKAFGKL